jgi:hypothetical protein
MTVPPGLAAHAARLLTGTTLTVEQATAHARGDTTTPPPPPAVTAAAVLRAGWTAAEDPAS